MPWKLTQTQVIDSPEISVLVFHNVYPEGKQGGVEIIQHGERIATNGDLRLEPAPGQWAPLPGVKGRSASAENTQVTVRLAFAQPEISYTVRVWTQSGAVELAVDLDRPLPDEWAGKVGFNLELLPSAFFGKAFFMDTTCGSFPRQANGPTAFQPSGMLLPMPMARGEHFIAAPEDLYRRLEVTAHAAAENPLLLFDGRNASQNGWFVLRQAIPAGAAHEAIRWTLQPYRVVGWRREPALLISQVGYHPDQEKQALIELGLVGGTALLGGTAEECALVRLKPDGEEEVVLSSYPANLGRFLHYRYARFDFTEAREPGMYLVRCGRLQSLPFKISREVYQEGIWQPTLETFLPVQMCHMRVEDFQRVWHGACHLDDAVQAPANHEHFDGYCQYAELETPFAEYEHIPGLDRGGWHDAGDYDLAAGSQASTTYLLALARETFSVDSDQTSVNRETRQVLLHVPDGVPDMVQQVRHGVENLLAGYHAAGHSFPGIIEGTLKQYTHLGDAATMTDNQFNPAGSANRDDRWAFTNRSTALEYQVAAALAAASRVLRGFEDALADECLSTAQKIWEYEHSHEPAIRPNVYIWNNPRATEILAAVELLISTGDVQYGQRLVKCWTEIEKHFSSLGWVAARVMPHLKQAGYAEKMRHAAQTYRDQLQAEMQTNPFRLPLGEGWQRANRPDHNPFAEDYHPPIWGIGWNLQNFGAHYYFLARAFPDLFDREALLRSLNYVLGCHPVNNLSLVSGVGAQSLTTAYGTNRAEWSYTPGGIVSGPALIRPDFLELMDPFPWLWQQKEYVISGAASYIFLVLAADDLLNRPIEGN